jgi:hypothetical protein
MAEEEPVPEQEQEHEQEQEQDADPVQQAVEHLAKTSEETDDNHAPSPSPKALFQLNVRCYDKADSGHIVVVSEKDDFTEDSIKDATLSRIRTLLMRKGAVSVAGYVPCSAPWRICRG